MEAPVEAVEDLGGFEVGGAGDEEDVRAGGGKGEVEGGW